MPLQEEPIHSLHVTSPSLSSLTEFPEKYAQRLQRAGFTTVSEIILISPDSLKSQTGLSSEQVEEVYHRLSETCSPKAFTISERIKTENKNKHSFISLGTPDLDRLFGSSDDNDESYSTNGIPTGLLTEIAGESACGKTCMSLQLSLNVQLPYSLGGLQGGCIYLCTESAFPSTRLYEMAVGLCQRRKRDPSSSFDIDTLEAINHLNVDDLMDNVHLLRAQDPQTLIHSIHYSLPAFLEKQNSNNHFKQHDNKMKVSNRDNTKINQKPIKLIVLDSIGAIFRADLEKNKTETNAKFRMTERASEMNQVADGLKFLADRYELAVLIVNQVSDVIGSNSNTNPINNTQGSNMHRKQESIKNQKNQAPLNHQQSLSSSSNPSSTPDSFGTLTPSTPTRNDSYDRSLIPLDYNQQARHFTGQKITNHRKEAALGLVWTNAINIRIMLNKRNTSLDLKEQTSDSFNFHHHLYQHQHPFIKRSSLTIREAIIVFSPFGKTESQLVNSSVQFVIISSGIVSVKDLSSQISSS